MLTVKDGSRSGGTTGDGSNPPGKDLTIPVLNLGLLAVYVVLNILVIMLAAVAWSTVLVQA